MSVFDTMERSKLQEKVLSGEIDSDCLLQDLVKWVTLVYYNLFANLDTGEHRACPVSRRGNAAYEFANGKPLTLMNGANLLYLMEKHGYKARIDLKEAKELLKE